MFINVKITSKNQNSLKRFIKNFKTLSKNKRLHLRRFLNFYQRKQNNKIFTILKSPHVNKKAQEQFEYNLYSKNLKIKSFQILKVLILLKNFQKTLHTDVDIKVKFIINEQKNYPFNKLENLEYTKKDNILLYLLTLNFYGNQKF